MSFLSGLARQVIREGDDVQSDQYCAAIILRSTYDRDTADLSAREKDLLKVARSFSAAVSL